MLKKLYFFSLFICLTMFMVSAMTNICFADDYVELGIPPEFPPVQSIPTYTEPQRELRANPLSVNPQNRDESKTFFNNYYLTSENSVMSWTGSQASCIAGTTALSFRNAILTRINYFRAMAGVPAGITFSDIYNAKAQKAALMMSANSSLSHSPPATWKCYTADGAEAAGSSNLSLGNSGPQAIAEAYMKDFGSGNYFVGHRRWLLYPQTQIMGTGDIAASGSYYTANDLWVFDTLNMWNARPATREEFVAWPPPGYVPYQIVYPRWSFAYPSADFSSATVSMTSGGVSLSVKKETIANNYGENTLVWIPMNLTDNATWTKPTQDTAYTVTLQNVKIQGISRTFTYTVTVFDPSSGASSVVKGDIDHSGKVDLRDAILGLQVTAGLRTTGYYIDADVNSDNIIGLPEVIYILRVLTGIL